jgi:hypothetical protein
MRMIDLMHKNLADLRNQLDEHCAKVVATTNLEIALLTVSNLPDAERLDFVIGLQEQLGTLWDELSIVGDNVDAASNLEANSLETAQAAEALSKLVDRGIVADSLLKQGFTLPEIVTIYDNLQSFASKVRHVFQEIRKLQDQLTRVMGKQSELSSGVNKIYWHIRLSRIAAELKKGGVQ